MVSFRKFRNQVHRTIELYIEESSNHLLDQDSESHYKGHVLAGRQLALDLILKNFKTKKDLAKHLRKIQLKWDAASRKKEIDYNGPYNEKDHEELMILYGQECAYKEFRKLLRGHMYIPNNWRD